MKFTENKESWKWKAEKYVQQMLTKKKKRGGGVGAKKPIMISYKLAATMKT